MAGKASGTGSPRGRRIRSACSADRFALVVLCASSQAFWTSYHGARPACCSRIPSWETVNRSLEGMVTPGRNDGDGDGAEARVGVFYGPLIAAVGLRCPGGRRRSPGYWSWLRRSSSSSSCMRARAVSSRARAASTRASAASSSARAVSAWDWAAWARAPAVRIPKVGR